MKQNWIIGYAAHFGPHEYLCPNDLTLITRLLQCRRCFIRYLYHQTIVSELKLNRKCYCKRPSVFNIFCLIRLIKTILKGFKLNHRIAPNTHVYQTFHYFSVQISNIHHTVYRTTVQTEPQYWVCPSHGRDLFELFYLNNSDDICDHIENSNKYFNVRNLFPKGYSKFYRSMQSIRSRDADIPDLSHSKFETMTTQIFYNPDLHLFNTKMNLNVACVKHDKANEFNMKGLSQRLIEANLRWMDSNSLSTNENISNQFNASKHRVHFPEGSPVSAVFNLRTYATASRLERANRMWEMDASHRYFNEIKRLIAKGYDALTAASLADQDDEEQDQTCLSDVDSNSGGSNVCLLTLFEQTINA